MTAVAADALGRCSVGFQRAEQPLCGQADRQGIQMQMWTTTCH